jgi:hypothetical protein
MNVNAFVKNLQSMKLLPNDEQQALSKFGETVKRVDLVESLQELGPDGGLPKHVIDIIYSELGGDGDFNVRSSRTSSEPIQKPRAIAESPSEPLQTGSEPPRTGSELVPLIIDESMLPAKALDEIEEIGQAMERAFDQALDSRLSRINPGDRAIAAIERRWGNARGAA